MTKEMDRIWEDARGEIGYREVHADHWNFATSYHGSGRFMLTIGTKGASSTQTQLHLTREELTTLADLTANALGGCLYLADEDSDSEMKS